MVLKPDVLAAAIDAAPHEGPRLLMSPRGEPLTQGLVRELSAGPGCLIVCGRFEGVDERVIGKRELREVSIGDYVLSGGEPAVLVLLDAIGHASLRDDYDPEALRAVLSPGADPLAA